MTKSKHVIGIFKDGGGSRITAEGKHLRESGSHSVVEVIQKLRYPVTRSRYTHDGKAVGSTVDVTSAGVAGVRVRRQSVEGRRPSLGSQR